MNFKKVIDPFTDEHLEYTVDELSKIWMRDKKQEMDNHDYIWKVMVSECFIKFYMDFFSCDKVEAELRISETPLDDESDSEMFL